MDRIIRTKAEIKKAVADKTGEFVIAPELSGEMAGIVEAMMLPRKKRMALLCFFGVGLIMILCLPMPEHVEGLFAMTLQMLKIAVKTVVGVLAAAAAVYVFSRISGIDWKLIPLLLIQSLLFGLSSAVKLLLTYEVIESGVAVEPVPGGSRGYGVRVRYRNK